MKSRIYVSLLLISVLFSAGCNQYAAVRDSQSGWLLANDQVEVFVTENGGQMAPVVFYRNSEQPIQPYYISPWQNEKPRETHPLLDSIRGDFFCMPFGANAEPYQGEQYNVHGETACDDWHFVKLTECGATRTLVMDMHTDIRKGHVTKTIALIDGQNILYITHTLEGFEGKMPIGHHANLAVPDTEGALKVSVGKFDLGMTPPMMFSNPASREYQSLAIGATFDTLEKVPLLWKEPVCGDCSSFPTRLGFTDLLCIYKKPFEKPAWTTAVNQQEGYLWFALKDASQLPATSFWISNKGRHGSPWNGRNRCLGLEETCGYFAEGLVPSIQPNIVSEKGFPTCITLSPQRPLVINMIQGVVKVPKNFGKVTDVEFLKNQIRFTSDNSQSVTADVMYDFIKTSKPM